MRDSFTRLEDVVLGGGGSTVTSSKFPYKQKTDNCTERPILIVYLGKFPSWGPTGFNLRYSTFHDIYSNDLAQNLRCKAKLFADDTSLFTTVQDPKTAASDMNHDLGLITSWANKWRMSSNPDPNKQAVEFKFSRKNTKAKHPVLLSNKTPVSTVLQYKYLGMILDTKLSFSAHIQAAIAKSRKAIGMLKFISKHLSRSTIDKLLKLYVRPHLDYGDVIQHILQDDDACLGNYPMEKLKFVQYSAALAVSGTWRGTSKERLYEELGWESLSARRWYRCLVLLYKFINSTTHDYTRALSQHYIYLIILLELNRQWDKYGLVQKVQI